jgi:predicted short-subunit dehydrogenase-like oxidoreductase (DUF2520 family)
MPRVRYISCAPPLPALPHHARVTNPESYDSGAPLPQSDLPQGWCDVVGRGRMGEALVSALDAAGVAVRGPFGRGADGDEAALVLLCVPDREIAAASAGIVSGPLVGHVSASASLDLLAPRERFALHPLLSVVGAGARFAGAVCAIDGSTPRALATARALAERLEMRPTVVAESHRALYHAAASAASNYLVTLEWMAEQLAERVGLDRAALVPLVRATVENWAEVGPRNALTGPIVRGDEETVQRQRAAVADAAPDLLPLWDALAAGTRALARLAQPEAGA